MTRTPLLQRGFISVSDFRCSAGPDDKPFVEQFDCHSISYVRKGSFGCRTRGKSFELVAGSILVGHPGDEYLCTHDHVCGDECLSFFLDPELGEATGARPPPLSEFERDVLRSLFRVVPFPWRLRTWEGNRTFCFSRFVLTVFRF